jgi:sec-independent protein translocase protein TatA
MPTPGPIELLIIATVILVLFGSRKLPDAARSMGRSLRIFKSEVRELHNDGERHDRPVESASVEAAPTVRISTDRRSA